MEILHSFKLNEIRSDEYNVRSLLMGLELVLTLRALFVALCVSSFQFELPTGLIPNVTESVFH